MNLNSAHLPRSGKALRVFLVVLACFFLTVIVVRWKFKSIDDESQLFTSDPRESTVSLLVTRLLASKSEEESSKTVIEIGQLGPQAISAIPALVDSLCPKSYDQQLSIAASVSLVKIGPASISAITDFLVHEKHVFARIRAIETLGRMGSDARPAVPSLVPHLTDRSLRIPVAAALAEIDQDVFTREAVPVLHEVIQNETFILHRILACELLGRVPSKNSLEVLLSAISDADQGVRQAASKGIEICNTKFNK